VNIESSLFADNERGLALLGWLGQTSVVNCTFSDNVAMHAGAGLLVLIDVTSPPIDVQRCTFHRNKAGLFRPSKIVNYEEQFRVNGDEVSHRIVSGDKQFQQQLILGFETLVRLRNKKLVLLTTEEAKPVSG
jgi:hypothetical protein